MPKQCIEFNCTNNQFGGGYCLYHQYKRKLATKTKREIKYTKAKEKALKKAIKPISDKQKEKNKLYEKAKKEKEIELREKGEWRCIFCGVPFEEEKPSGGWHHTMGRDGDLTFDKKYIFPCHFHCHIVVYHSGDYALLSSQIWYKSFLERIKEIDIKLYYKEIEKGNK